MCPKSNTPVVQYQVEQKKLTLKITVGTEGKFISPFTPKSGERGIRLSVVDVGPF